MQASSVKSSAPLDRVEAFFQRYRKLVFWGLILTALMIRIYRLGTYSLWGDEADTIWAGLKRIYFHPPLFIYLASWWIKWAQSEFALRFLATIFSVATVAATWFLAKRVLQSYHGAFWASLFIVFSPSQVYFARDFRMYSLFTLVAALSWLTYLEWMKKGGWHLYLMTVLMGSLTIYTHHYGAFFLVSQGLSAFVIRPRKKSLPKLAGYAVGVFLIYCPYLREVWFLATRHVGSNSWAPPITWKTPIYLMRFLLAGLEAPRIVVVVLGLIGAGLAATGFFRQKGYEFRLIVVFGFVVPIIGAMAVSYILPTSMLVARYMIFTAIPLAIAMAAGIEALFHKKWCVVFTVYFLIVQSWATTLQYRNIYLAESREVREREQFREAADIILQSFEEGDIVGTTCLSGAYPAWYYLTYLHNIPMRLVDVDDIHREHLQGKYNQNDFIHDVYTIIEPINLDMLTASGDYRRIWLYESQWEPGIRPGDFYYDQRIRCRNWLSERHPLLGEWFFKGVDVRLFDFRIPVPQGYKGSDDEQNYTDGETPAEAFPSETTERLGDRLMPDLLQEFQPTLQ